jgi:multidrug efflux pump subunit AcrB
MSEGGKEIPIILRLQEKHRMNPNELERMFIPTQGEGSVRLGMVGRMETRLAEKVLYRHNKKDARLFAVGDQGSIESLDSPRAEQTADFTRTCLFMAIAALTLLYFTLGAQFESWTIPLLLLLALPLAFAGASGALYLTGKTLNLHSMIGMLILFGTAVNNTILLYEHCVHSLARRPYGRIGPVIYRACIEKSGAVLLTSLTTLCALIPFAIDPGNASAQSHLAVAIIGGFGVSTPLVLAITPILLTATLKGRRV